MKKVRCAALAASLMVLALTGCSTLDALNPFSSSGPKMAELQPITTSLDARQNAHTPHQSISVAVFR